MLKHPVMLDAPQETIAIEHPGRLGRGQRTDHSETSKRVIDIPSTDRLVDLPVEQLQELDQVFDIANPSPSHLQFGGVLSGGATLEHLFPAL